MVYQRDDGVFEIECDRCNTKLTEIAEGAMPTDTPTAYRMAWASGWVILPTENVCYGCTNVSK